MHAVLVDPPLPGPGEPLTVTGEEAHHALRVKRLTPGTAFHVLDGAGGVGLARVDGSDKLGKHDWQLHATMESIEEVSPLVPAIELCTGVPKGPRLDDMIEGLSQVGVSRWAPLLTRRSVVDPRQGKLDRTSRVARESIKQCLRATPMTIDRPITFDQAIRPLANPGARLVIADATGEPLSGVDLADARLIRVLIGPEGGFEPEEIEQARGVGARLVRFGRHVMRIETAAVVAGAMLAQLGTP